MKNIYLISTNKPSKLQLQKVTKELLLYNDSLKEDAYTKPVNMYITSDEEIKEGDWCLGNQGTILKVSLKWISSGDWRKIILTTDQDLIKDGVQAIDDEFLEWLVENPSCEEVAIERWTDYKLKNNEEVIFFNYKIIIPKEEPKQEILEEAKQMMVTQEDILEQIALTEARGEKIVKYLNRYKGDSIYNEIALAIEFGYQLKLEEDEK